MRGLQHASVCDCHWAGWVGWVGNARNRLGVERRVTGLSSSVPRPLFIERRFLSPQRDTLYHPLYQSHPLVFVVFFSASEFISKFSKFSETIKEKKTEEARTF